MLRRCARDDFQIGDLGQARQDFILDAIGEVSVGFVLAQIFKRQHRDALFGNAALASVSVADNERKHSDASDDRGEQESTLPQSPAQSECALVFLAAAWNFLRHCRIAKLHPCRDLRRETRTPCFTSHSPSSCRSGCQCGYSSRSSATCFESKNVSGIAAIHHSLRHVNSSAGEIGPFVYIDNAADWSAVDSHPELQVGMFLERATDLPPRIAPAPPGLCKRQVPSRRRSGF